MQRIELYNNQLSLDLMKSNLCYPTLTNGVITSVRPCPLTMSLKRQEWTLRLDAERYNPRCIGAFFVNLSYDNEHLPVVDLTECTRNEETGEIEKYYIRPLNGVEGENSYQFDPNIIPVLYRKDITTYLKALKDKIRYYFDDRVSIRFFYKGEYGGNNMRPHYHILVYVYYWDVLPPIELVLNTDSSNYSQWLNTKRGRLINDLLYTVQQFCISLWHYAKPKFDYEKGEWACVTIEEIESDGCGAYVCKYCTKQESEDMTESAVLVPEFTGCSPSSKHIDYATGEIVNTGLMGEIALSRTSDLLIYDLKEWYRNSITKSLDDVSLFNPKIVINDFEKPLPRSLKRRLYEIVDNMSQSTYQTISVVYNAWLSHQHADADLPTFIAYQKKTLRYIREERYIDALTNKLLLFNAQFKVEKRILLADDIKRFLSSIRFYASQVYKYVLARNANTIIGSKGLMPVGYIEVDLWNKEKPYSITLINGVDDEFVRQLYEGRLTALGKAQLLSDKNFAYLQNHDAKKKAKFHKRQRQRYTIPNIVSFISLDEYTTGVSDFYAEKDFIRSMVQYILPKKNFADDFPECECPF